MGKLYSQTLLGMHIPQITILDFHTIVIYEHQGISQGIEPLQENTLVQNTDL